MKNTLLLLTAIAPLAISAYAQPAFINYQGRLLDASGQPLTNGTYTMEFNFYDSAIAGTKVWGPLLYDDGDGNGHAPRVVVANGRFNVILGPEDTAGRSLTNAFGTDERFVEIKVDAGDPILPRQQFLSAPYALRSRSAQEADLATVARNLVQELADALCPPGSILAFAGPTNKIPSGWLLCDGRSFLTNDYPQLHAAIGTAWGGSGTLFSLPDFRGLFLRGVNHARSDGYQDPDKDSRTPLLPGGAPNDVGSVQTNDFKSHHHRASGTHDQLVSKTAQGYNALNPPYCNTVAGQMDAMFSKQMPATGGNETRPNNAYVNYIIKY